MQRIVVLVSIVALTLVGMLVTSTWPNVAAQDSASTMANHPVVGTWWWQNISADPFDDSFGIFHADGTYVEETPYIGAGIGTWVPTGERTADLIIIFQDLDGGFDPSKPAAFVAGTITFRLAIEVDATGNVLASRGPLEFRSPDGTLQDEPTYDFAASRVTVDWSMPTPAATPTS